MDPEKFQAVVDWPTPSTHKHVHRSLGFTNFYQKIYQELQFHNYSSPCPHLSKDRIPMGSPAQAEEAFQCLKKCFTSAPVLSSS